jgi:magnesium transporter
MNFEEIIIALEGVLVSRKRGHSPSGHQPKASIGSVMTSDYASIPAEPTAREALDHLRRIAPDAEAIHQAFVIDTGRRLLRTVSLHELIVAAPTSRVSEPIATFRL